MTFQVFLAEDLKPVQDLLAELLADAGPFRVAGTATTEAEAKLWLDEHPGAWDLAIVDLVLSQGTGMGVLVRARETHPRGQVVVFSDYVTPGIRQHCLALGAAAVFQKSGQSAELLAFFAELAAGPRSGPRSL